MEEDRPIALSVIPPVSTNVEYYEPVDVKIAITNVSNDRLLVEEIALRFQSDDGLGTVQIEGNCGRELKPKDVIEQTLQVVPNPHYMKATNYFDVKAQVRVIGESLGDSLHLAFKRQSYLVIREPESA